MAGHNFSERTNDQRTSWHTCDECKQPSVEGNRLTRQRIVGTNLVVELHAGCVAAAQAGLRDGYTFVPVQDAEWHRQEAAQAFTEADRGL